MNAKPSRLARWRSLSGAQRGTLLWAWFLLPVFWLGLRTLGLPRLQARIAATPLAKQPLLPLTDVQALGDAVNIAARHTPFHVTCLSRSLVLGWLLRQRGVASDLRIGARLVDGGLDAHAWVEFEGTPVNDRADIAQTFATFGDIVPLAAFDQ